MASSSAMRLTSAAFPDGGAIPARYGCDGRNVSPPLEWSGAPPDAKAFALLVTDPDAHGFVHWAAFDIPSSSVGLLEGASGTGAAGREGRNDFGRQGWGGPCPPSGTHHYVFDLCALSGRVIAEARLSGTYRRGSS